MKIAVASSGKNLESLVDSRFGRCPYFLIIDDQTDKFEVVENTAGQTFRGAGVSAAQMVADQGARVVVAGNFGPNAVNVLGASGIKILTTGNLTMKIKQALIQYKGGELQPVTTATGPFGPGMGRGMGRGRRGSQV